MTRVGRNILIGFGTFVIGICIAIGINMITEYLFIVDNGYCYEYRFPKLSWLLDFLYEGYHYDTNLFNFLLTLLLGFYIANRLIKFSLKRIVKIKSHLQ